jgi:hypothetical protein
MEIAVQDHRSQNITLRQGAITETVDAQGQGTRANLTGTVGTVVDQNLVAELPLNGRSFQTLFQLTPGVVITPTSFASQGQFSVNGQRTDTNYFLIDGVSATFGISVAANPGQSAGGSLPALTALGGTNSLVSTDDVQEFAILTSSLAPEFGRTPGGQISIVTRSGTNEVHGAVFDYLRNEALDANDWFANQQNLKRGALRQNDFGGVLGGPIQQNRSFYFLSYEGLRLRQPTTGESDVPSLATRQSALPAIKPFFYAYPLPTGRNEGTGLAEAIYAFSNPSSLDAASLRMDQHFGGHLALFGRYNVSASDQKLRGATVSSLSSVTDLRFALQTLTIGSTWSVSPHLTNDTRLNWSRSFATFDVLLDGFGGAVPISDETVFPVPFSQRDSLFQLFLALNTRHPDLEFGRNVANSLSQVNLIDSCTLDLPGHTVRGGIDFRRLSPRTKPARYQQEALFSDIPSALTGRALLGIVQSSTSVESRFLNWSLFVEDTWRPLSRLTLTYGMRWEFNPTPTGRGANGLAPFAVRGIGNLSALSLAPPGTPLYRTTADNFAPRFGLAYQFRNDAGSESVVKAGVGIVYDFANGPVGNAFSSVSFPFSATKTLAGVSFPLSQDNASPAPITTSPPFGPMPVFPAVLKLPYTYQWNLSVEQSLGREQTISVGYAGSVGHSLFRTEQYVGGLASVPLSFKQLLFTNNGGYSNDHALLAQLKRRTSRGLDVLASYTYSHSLDNVSTDAIFNVPQHLVSRRTDYGSSDFDLRHIATFAVDYSIPAPSRSSPVKTVISNWTIDPIFMFRSSPPVNIVFSRQTAPGIPFRPNVVPGAPLYVDDPGVAGRRRINSAAFLIPVGERQGDLGRNHLRGFPLFQVDVALRRKFRVKDNVAVQLRIEAFNLFNHPNFAPESGQLGVTNLAGTFFPQSGFGISGNSFGNGLQGGGPGSGFSPLYQIGQARSLQMAVQLQF